MLNVKYVRGPGGKFRGSLPKGKVAPLLPPSSDCAMEGDELPSADAGGVVDAWIAFERSKRNSSDDDALVLAHRALEDYQRRTSEAMSQDDLYEAQEIYLTEVAEIPLGHLDTNVEEAWAEYQRLDPEASSESTPQSAPHGWLLVVAANSRSGEALHQAWEASDEIASKSDDGDPRLDTVDAVRLQLLEFNTKTPASVFESAYGPERLDAMKASPEGDYVEHLVRLPVGAAAISRQLRDDVARRLGDWAEENEHYAEDIDDAARDFYPGDEPRIPVFLTDIDSSIVERYSASPSRAIAASCGAAEQGFRLIPRKA